MFKGKMFGEFVDEIKDVVAKISQYPTKVLYEKVGR